jgi:hypothetical protein
MSERSEDLGTYEMLWDCRSCGTQKLLGLTHRRCPNCGGVQDPSWRYYPSDDDKVLAKDHAYAGADRTCPACGTAMGRAAAFCANCGRELKDAKDVSLRQGQVQAEGVAFAAESVQDAKREHASARAKPAPVRRSPWPRRLLVGGLLVVGLVLLAIFWKRPVGLSVQGHAWERHIDIERFGPRHESAWCDQMPGDAYSVSRSREQRSSRQVQDGEECSMHREDKGDGTYRQVRKCKPKYRSEPVYDQKCSFSVDRWSVSRTASAKGASLDDQPRWPEVGLGRTGQCLGCEREGRRRETYTVRLSDGPKGKSHECSVGQAKWAGFRPGSRWQGRTGVLTGGLDCSSLLPSK